LRGKTWDFDGTLATIAASESGGDLSTPDYPDAFDRLWSALEADSTGEILVSAAPDYEFVDWGGADHTGGGSHGSLLDGDSRLPIVFFDCGPDLADAHAVDGRREWSITDVAPVVAAHFGLDHPNVER
jgi:hypothetical protein